MENDLYNLISYFLNKNASFKQAQEIFFRKLEGTYKKHVLKYFMHEHPFTKEVICTLINSGFTEI